MREALAIEIRDLVKSYGRVRALRGVNLEVRRGEIFAFLGPNGAGKTTTIRCMLDFIRPDAGLLRVLGIDPQRDPVAVRRRVGYLPGELHFDENMTVEGALRLFAAMRGNTVDWAYVRALAERLDLDLRPRIRNLSKGNKQKVGVIQALMHRPELLILDEPTLGLDPLMQREVLRLMREARDAGATVFFASHIMSEVEQVADRVGIIRQGVVVEVAGDGGSDPPRRASGAHPVRGAGGSPAADGSARRAAPPPGGRGGAPAAGGRADGSPDQGPGGLPGPGSGDRAPEPGGDLPGVL
jgi:ABC-2 type transport system ATP-binding protein